MKRDGISEDYARSRIAAQHEEDWFREKCGYILENNSNLDAFATKCLAFLAYIGIM
jgi:dephospho-CoA kinase